MGRLVGAALAIALGAWPTITCAAPVTYHCSFPDVFDLDHGLTKQDFTFTVAYDTVTQTAAIIGNVGVSSLTVHAGPLAVTFMEMVDSGVVQTLTVRPSGDAVYSRHTVELGGDGFIASQQYGTCKP